MHTHTHTHTLTLKYESLKVKSSLLPLTDKITGHDDVKISQFLIDSY